jgi:hypothetical protein
MKGLDKLFSEIRRTNSLDWREFNFFKAGAGLSRNDQVSIQVCLDYELARESPQIVEWQTTLSARERQEDLQQLQQTISTKSSRYFLGTDEEKKRMFLFPKVCVAASWFPSPWLSAPPEEREKIIKMLAALYDDTAEARESQWLSPLPELPARNKEAIKELGGIIKWVADGGARTLAAFEFPMKDQKRERMLIATTTEERNITLHVFAINRAQTKSALVAAFKAWIEKQPDISGKESLRGRVKAVAALRDLGCYRLMTKLDALSRQVIMDEASFKQSVPKLSEAKRRTEKRLQYLGYT